MADKKITQLSALTTTSDADLLATVDDPGGTAVTKKITRADLIGSESQTMESGKQYLADPGTVAAPGVAFSGDANTGAYQISSDKMGFAAGGVKHGGLDNTSGSEGFEAEGCLVMKNDRQLVAADFPNATTLYGWNMDSTTDTAAESAYAGTKFGVGKDLTLKAQKLTAANDVLGNSKYNAIIAGGYLQSTDAVFNVANTADTDDFMVGGWVYMPDMTPAATVGIFSNSAGANDGWYVQWGTTGKVAAVLDLATDLTTSQIPMGTTPAWKHIVFAREVGVGTKLYVNGSLVGLGADSTSLGTTQSKFQLGGINGANNLPEAGTRYDECFFKKGILPTNLDDVVRKIYERSAKKFAVLDANANVVIPQNASCGIYTPTITNGANVAASNASPAFWMRVGDMVQVTGKMQIDPTAAATDTILTLSLPIGTDIVDPTDLAGVVGATNGAQYGVGYINGDAATDTAVINISFVGTANSNVGYQFSYMVN